MSTPGIVKVIIPDSSQIIKVTSPGTPRKVRVITEGPQGPAGPMGPTGSAGGGFEYVQASPLATWTIPRNPAVYRKPTVTIFSTSGSMVESDVDITDDFVIISFPAPFAGTAVIV
jgi:hypothetical protein